MTMLAIFCLQQLIRYIYERSRANSIDKENENAKRAFDELEKSIEEDIKTLYTLLPALRKEYDKQREQMLSELDGMITNEEKANLCTDLPTSFWWEITPSQLSKIEYKLDWDGSPQQYGSCVEWETKWVQRKKDTAFKNAGEECSPLLPIYEDEEISKAKYKECFDIVTSSDDTGYVLDFVTRGTSSTMESETIEYEQYKYSDSMRDDVTFLEYLAGYSLDSSYNQGKIKQEDYIESVANYVADIKKMDDIMNQKETVTKTHYYQVKTNVNIWTGQILLVNTDAGLSIIDYRCQMYHVLRNLDALKDINVTRVFGDVIYRNPIVLAKIHKVCPNCR